jgi:hypothetical protein
MNSFALFGLGIVMSFLAFTIVTKVYIWPRLRNMGQTDALVPLVIPHIFRFAGLSFLVPGVVSPSLPQSFAVPAAYGDLLAAILAAIATLSLVGRKPWAIPSVWVFNVLGAVDLLAGYYQGRNSVGNDPGLLGAAYFIPTVVVPPLLVTHALIFRLLLRPKQ